MDDAKSTPPGSEFAARVALEGVTDSMLGTDLNAIAIVNADIACPGFTAFAKTNPAFL